MAETCVYEGCDQPRVKAGTWQGKQQYRRTCSFHARAQAAAPTVAGEAHDRPQGRFPWRPPVDLPMVRDAERRCQPAAETYEADEQRWWAALRWLGENRGRVPAFQEDRIAIRLFLHSLVGNLTAWGERWTDDGSDIATA